MKIRENENRALQFIFAFVVLLLCGLIYAWSLFIEPLESDFGWDRSQTSLIFTISLICFSLGMLAAGWLDKRGHTRLAMNLGAALAAVGFVASAFTPNLLWIYVSYGVAVGLASGFCTDCVMGVVARWYPDKQGLISGALLMGFGMGSMILGPIVTMMLSALSWRMTFFILGVVFGAIVFAIGLFMHDPTDEYYERMVSRAKEADRSTGREYTAGEMLKTRSFWIYIIWLILVSSGGLGLISQAVPAAQEVLAAASSDTASAAMLATMAMGSVSLCNGLGRLISGFLWDRFGYRLTVRTISAAYILSMALCALAVFQSSFVLIVAGFMLLGLVYGANMSSMAAMSGGFFGAKYFSVNYAVATCQMIVSASIGPLLLAWLQGSSGSYFSSFCAFLLIAVAAAVVSLLIRSPQD